MGDYRDDDVGDNTTGERRTNGDRTAIERRTNGERTANERRTNIERTANDRRTNGEFERTLGFTKTQYNRYDKFFVSFTEFTNARPTQ